MSEEGFMNRITHYEGWNHGVYGWFNPVPKTDGPVPLVVPLNSMTFWDVGAGNDCHDEVERAIVAAGGKYPGSALDRFYWGPW